jgi:GTPase involved in cell partitioning and DNA repair
MGPKAKKKARKRLTPLQKIRKELGKLEALHEKENAIVEKIDEIIEEAEEDDENYDFDKWEGTDPD